MFGRNVWKSLIVLCSVSASMETVSTAPLGDLSGAVDQANGILTAGKELKQNLLTVEPKGRETAKIETEGLPSRVLGVYDDKQRQTASFFNPKPILDTISEEEKYGNNGDKFYPIGRALVNGYEAFSNFMNRILDAPSSIGKLISTNIVSKLDNVGGRLVGLQ